MAFIARSFAFTALLANLVLADSGTGTTTRYWDCCKPSCAWNDLSTLGIDSAVKSCDKSDNPLTDASVASGCSGGSAYMCSDQSPWAVSDSLAYGFAAVSASKQECCQCYQLSFTSGAASGKKMIVQATNTGSDVGSTQFDIAIPGGGYGIFDGCSTEWAATSSVWGAQYGGSSTNTCSQFPTALQPGCDWRWDWFGGSDNPTVEWETVACPKAITDKSGCVRTGDTPTGSDTSSSSSIKASTSSVATSSTALAASSQAASSSKTTATTSSSAVKVSSNTVVFSSTFSTGSYVATTPTTTASTYKATTPVVSSKPTSKVSPDTTPEASSATTPKASSATTPKASTASIPSTYKASSISRTRKPVRPTHKPTHPHAPSDTCKSGK